MRFIDTHAHLYLEQFSDDVDDVIQRAQQEGIQKIVLPNIDSKSLHGMLELCRRYPHFCLALPGLHPTHVKENFQDELSIVKEEVKKNIYKGIGEIGIDLYWDKTYIKQQQEAFEFQLDLALEHDLPVVIHARDSFNEILEIVRLSKYKNIKGVFHAFTGDEALAHQIISMGFYLGIGGIVTFKNSNLSAVVKNIDLNHLLLETDSPYLAPSPNRGKRNESSYISLVARRIADIKNIDIKEVATTTTNNAINLFQL